ncbi:transposase [Rheinheimera aquimaris]|uniref:transposase n=1 Tax=Rheinheimera aquimaris TaxID=412437 RepID=UPI001064C46F
MSKKEKPAENQRFVQRLKDILPAHYNPIIVTDSGFKVPWFKLVQQQSWDFVGRIRGTQCATRLTMVGLAVRYYLEKPKSSLRHFQAAN